MTDDFEAAVQAAMDQVALVVGVSGGIDLNEGAARYSVEAAIRHVGAVARRDALRACWDAAEGFSLLNVHAAYEAAKAEAEQAVREVTT